MITEFSGGFFCVIGRNPGSRDWTRKSSPAIRVAMATVLHLKRLEKSPWQLVGLGAALTALVWMIVDRAYEANPIAFLGLVLAIIAWGARMHRWRKTPDLSLEIDSGEIRLLPQDHWRMEPISLDSIKLIREEALSLWIYYLHRGSEKALELQRSEFTPGEWEELIRLTRERKEVPVVA